MTAALVQAARNGANVWAIAPYSQKSSNTSDAQQIVAAGGHWVNEYTGASFTPITSGGSLETGIQSPMDIHSKFALIDGVAYMDGHNWFSNDVIMRDGSQGDFNVIENNLSSFATPAPSNGAFTSDKQVSLDGEYAYLQNVLPSVTSTSEFDWSSESYNPNPASGNYNADVFAGLCAIAASPARPVMKFYVEEYPYNAAAGTDIQYMVSFNPNSEIYSSSGGLEKVALLRSTIGGNASTIWFGSSNATTTDLFDWGMTITDSGMITAVQQWFDSGISGVTPVAKTTPTISSCPVPSI
jgi:hypothetical protein